MGTTSSGDGFLRARPGHENGDLLPGGKSQTFSLSHLNSSDGFKAYTGVTQDAFFFKLG